MKQLNLNLHFFTGKFKLNMYSYNSVPKVVHQNSLNKEYLSNFRLVKVIAEP